MEMMMMLKQEYIVYMGSLPDDVVYSPTANHIILLQGVIQGSALSILAAFDDAISDGVEIITVSLRGDHAFDYHEDPIAIGAFHGLKKGVLTVNSAGNFGPFRGFISSGYTVNNFTLNKSSFPLMYGKKPLNNLCIGFGDNARSCLRSFLNSTLVKGKILLCDELPVTSIANVTCATYSKSGALDAPFVEPYPSLGLSLEDYTTVWIYYNSTSTIYYLEPPCLGPHVAGVAAYVKPFHHNWSPSAIKSSLMTTAWVMNNTQSSDSKFGYGARHVNLVEAIDPGLVYENSQEDYIKFLCGIGYTQDSIRSIIGDSNSTCPKVSNEPKDLNYPSFSHEGKIGSFTVDF
nr:cucumisin-like [Ziziphus jujuba var. spinosa]